MKNQGTPDGLRNFSEFWPYYVREHRNGVSRALHVIGSMSGLALLVFLVVNELWAWIWVPVVVGYGFAWIGHFVFEKNRPATFRYPLYSFIGDVKMISKVLTGRMRSELERHGK